MFLLYSAKQLLIVLVLLIVASIIDAVAAQALDPGDRFPLEVMRPRNATTLKRTDLQGKVVVVDVWASWCGPCRYGVAQMQRWHKLYHKKGLVVVGLSVDSDLSSASDFAKQYGLTFPWLWDGGAQYAKIFAPPKMPTTYLFDRRGNLVLMEKGFSASRFKELEAKIRTLLQR